MKLLLLVLVIIGYSFASQPDDLEDVRYCEMVALWVNDAKIGVAEGHRVGWPPYKGTEQCQSE